MKKHPLHMLGRLVAGRNTQWITLSVWILITLLLSFTLPQVNSTKEPNPKKFTRNSYVAASGSTYEKRVSE